jgi:hypothetical protein
MTPFASDRPANHALHGDARQIPTEQTTYWVYAAYPNQWATIHQSGCRHCRDGRGQVGSPVNLTTTDWFGPFPTRAEAFARADRTRLKMVRGCRHCCP